MSASPASIPSGPGPRTGPGHEPSHGDALRVVHLASLARSGETMLLRALDAHPQVQVVHDLRAVNSDLDQRLYRLLRVWPLPHLPRWQLDAHLAPGWLRPGARVLLLKQGVFAPRQRPEGFGLIRNPYAVFSSLWSYDARLAGQTPDAALNARYWRERRLPRLLAWAEASAAGAGFDLHAALRAESDPVRQFLLYWRARALQIRAQQPLTITYEAFVADPQATLQRVLGALRLPMSDDCLQAHTLYARGARGHGGIDLGAPVRAAPAWTPDALVPLAPFAAALDAVADALEPAWRGLYDRPPLPLPPLPPLPPVPAPAVLSAASPADQPTVETMAPVGSALMPDRSPDFLRALTAGDHARARQAWQQVSVPEDIDARLAHMRRGLRLLQAEMDAAHADPARAETLRLTAAALLAADPLALALEVTLLRKLDPAAYDRVRAVLLAQRWFDSVPGARLAPLALALEQLDPQRGPHLDMASDLLQTLPALALGKLFRHPALPRNGQLLLALARRVLDAPAAPAASAAGWTPTGWFHLLTLGYAILPRPMFDRLLRHLRALPDTPVLADLHAHPQARPGPQTRRWATEIARRFVLDGDPAPPSASASAPAPALHLRPGGPRLRIALCLSGQMRGWREARATWQHLGLEGHDVDVYIHTWRDLGRRLPDPEIMPSVRRVFDDDAFAEAYIRAGHRFGLAALQQAWPALFAGLASRGRVDESELVRVFGPDTTVVVDDDAAPAFAAWDNQSRMHYKIHAAQQLAQDSRRGHDLLIRLRPDKLLRGASARPDWIALAAQSAREQVLFCEEPVGLREGLVMGDQFAAGAPAPMQAYAQAWFLQPHAAAAGWPGFPPRFTGHTSLAFTCLYQGLRPQKLDGVDFGPMAEASRIGREEVWRLLRIDRPHGPRDELDRLLWAAWQPAPVSPPAPALAAGRVLHVASHLLGA